MAVPIKYAHTYYRIKFFLSSYRTLVDAQIGLDILDELVSNSEEMPSGWRVSWTGICATIRTSIFLFSVDSKSCLPEEIRKELSSEWQDIKSNRHNHKIFWEFLKKERDNIIHMYEWQAYAAAVDINGEPCEYQYSLLGPSLSDRNLKPAILMKDGEYKGHNSLHLLREAANWAEDRIVTSIKRAGFDPDEERSLHDFSPRKPDASLLTFLPAAHNVPSSLLGK